MTLFITKHIHHFWHFVFHRCSDIYYRLRSKEKNLYFGFFILTRKFCHFLEGLMDRI